MNIKLKIKAISKTESREYNGKKFYSKKVHAEAPNSGDEFLLDATGLTACNRIDKKLKPGSFIDAEVSVRVVKSKQSDFEWVVMKLVDFELASAAEIVSTPFNSTPPADASDDDDDDEDDLFNN